MPSSGMFYQFEEDIGGILYGFDRMDLKVFFGKTPKME